MYVKMVFLQYMEAKISLLFIMFVDEGVELSYVYITLPYWKQKWGYV